jgi:hypothetical protein
VRAVRGQRRRKASIVTISQPTIECQIARHAVKIFSRECPAGNLLLLNKITEKLLKDASKNMGKNSRTSMHTAAAVVKNQV